MQGHKVIKRGMDVRVINESDTKELDREWIALMKQAKELGLTTQDIRKFFKNNQQPMNKNR